MKKTWIFLLVAPLMTLSAAYPTYDDEYETNDLETPFENHRDQWDQEGDQENLAHEESREYEDELQQDEIYVAPQRPSRRPQSRDLSSKQRTEQHSKPDSSIEQKKRSIAQMKRGTEKRPRSSLHSPSARTRMRDARANSKRPRVTHRSQGQRVLQETPAIEADMQNEENSTYQEERQNKQAYSQKGNRSQEMAEKRTERVQRHSSASQRRINGKNASKRHQERIKSYHHGKRPLND